MKFKTNDPEKKPKMNKDLYDLFINLIQFEIEKSVFIKSAEKYFDLNGYQDYDSFFKDIELDCLKFKDCVCEYLLNRLETLPDFKYPAIDIDFSNPQEIFDSFASLEANAFDKLNKFDHIACRAREAVKNNQPIRDLPQPPMPW